MGHYLCKRRRLSRVIVLGVNIVERTVIRVYLPVVVGVCIHSTLTECSALLPLAFRKLNRLLQSRGRYRIRRQDTHGIFDGHTQAANQIQAEQFSRKSSSNTR